jgi:hypothetical protein
VAHGAIITHSKNEHVEQPRVGERERKRPRAERPGRAQRRRGGSAMERRVAEQQQQVRIARREHVLQGRKRDGRGAKRGAGDAMRSVPALLGFAFAP